NAYLSSSPRYTFITAPTRCSFPPRCRPTPTLFPYTTLFRSLLLLFDLRHYAALADFHHHAIHRRGFTQRENVNALHPVVAGVFRSEEHTSELQSRENLVCRLLLEKKTEPHWLDDERPAEPRG